MINYVDLEKRATMLGLHVATYSPGDGHTRYRFFAEAGSTYFGPANGLYTALGAKEAGVWLAGYAAALHQGQGGES